jgi:hypothetical protein
MQSLRQLERDESSSLKFYSIALLFFFLLNFAFFLYKVNCNYKYVLVEQSSFVQFSFFVFLVLVAFLVKFGVTRLLTFSLSDSNLLPEFNYSSIVISQTLGVFLFPFMVLAELGKVNQLLFLSIAAVILLAMQAFKWYRGIVFSLVENRVGLLQIFTYFCSLEILPALVVVKFVIEKF